MGGSSAIRTELLFRIPPELRVNHSQRHKARGSLFFLKGDGPGTLLALFIERMPVEDWSQRRSSSDELPASPAGRQEELPQGHKPRPPTRLRQLTHKLVQDLFPAHRRATLHRQGAIVLHRSSP